MKDKNRNKVNKIKSSWKDKLFKTFIVILFIFIINWPSIIKHEPVNWIYVLFGFVIGLPIGKEIVDFYQKNGKSNKKKFLLSNKIIFIYVLVYSLILVLLDLELLKKNFSLFSFKFFLSTYLIFYGGLKSIQTEKRSFRGGQMTKRQSIISGIISVVIAILILIITMVVRL